MLSYSSPFQDGVVPSYFPPFQEEGVALSYSPPFPRGEHGTIILSFFFLQEEEGVTLSDSPSPFQEKGMGSMVLASPF